MKAIIKITGFVLLLLIALNMSISAQFAGGWYSQADYMYQNLPDLTDKQKSELTALKEKYMEKRDAIVKEMWGTTDLYKRNAAAIRLQDLRISESNDVMNLLTDEQKNALYLNNSYYGFGRGLGPCGAGYGIGRGAGRGIGWGNAMGTGYGVDYGFGRGMGPCGAGYALGRGAGRGMGRGVAYGMGRIW